MGIFKRTLYGIIKRAFRSISLAVILFISVIGTLLGCYLDSILNNYQAFIEQEIGHCVDLVSKDDAIGISDSIAREISGIDSVVGYNSEASIEVTPVDFDNYIPEDILNSDFDLLGDKTKVRMYGSTNTLYSAYFFQGQVECIEGDYPAPNSNGVMIEKEFAKSNSLHISDVMHIYSEGMDQEIPLNIVGIYEINTQATQGMEISSVDRIYKNTPYSHIFCDYSVLGQISSPLSIKSSYVFYAKDAKGGEQIIKYINSMDLDNDIYECYNQSEVAFSSFSTIMGVLKNSSQTLLLIINFSLYIIIFLMTFLWMRDHYREAGIYIALGRERVYIVFDYIIELIALSVSVFFLSATLFSSFLKGYGKSFVEFLVNVSAEETGYQSLDLLFINDYIGVEILVPTVLTFLLVIMISALFSGLTIFCYPARNLFDIKN